jgi:hypothetical protein
MAAATCVSLATIIPAANASQSHALTSAPRVTTIVFLRSPSALVSPSEAHVLARAEQTNVAQLAARLGVPVLARTSVPSTLTLKLTAAQAHQFATNPFVAHVLVNSQIPGPALSKSALASRSGAASGHLVRAHASCGTSLHPQLNPEALGNINAPAAWAQGATGAGIKVAYLAEGIDPTNPDLQRNAAYASAGSPTGTPVITTYADFSGDGPGGATGAEAWGDASSIAAQGNTTYDLSTFVSPTHPLPAGCDIKIVGSAPGASIVALKIFASTNFTTGSGFIQAINYAVTSGVKVINESFGGNPMPDTSIDIIRIANDAAVAAGVTVVVSSGDAGISSTIGSPSTDPKVLSVGASTTFRAYQQDTFGGINLPGEAGGFIDNNISSLSSGGFAQNGKTVNLVAPGDLNWSLCAASACGAAVQLFGGTSESAPLTSGAAADVIGAYAKTHGGSFPSPALVEHILTSTAKDVFAPATQQGAGLLDIGAAVALARSIHGTTAAHPAGGLLSDTSQINLSGAPNSNVSKTFKLTNTGTKKLKVKLSTRGLVQIGKPTTGSVTLDPSVSTAQPKFIIWSGASEIYQKATFTVKPGVARLQFQSGYQDVGQTSLVHIAVFDPHGNLAGYSLPQGLGDYADVEVANPAAGKWTAGFFTVWNGFGSGNVGSSGPVPWTATSFKYGTLGAVSPSAATLPAGGSVTVKYKTKLASTPGDAGASIVISTPTKTTTIPVTLRATIQIGKGGGHFAGILTGGNGRGGTPGQMNTYAFSVPSGKTDLDVGVALGPNAGNAHVPCDQLIGLLVDPSGQIAAYDANYTLTAGGEVCSPFLNLYKSHPAKGNWSLVLDWAQPGTGTATSVGFTGSVQFNAVSTSNTLPHSSSTLVPVAGATFGVTVHNHGVAPMLLSPDARSAGSTVVALQDLFGYPSTAPMPNAQNYFYVPTESSSYSVSVSGTIPLTFDTGNYVGDPDISPALPAPNVVETQTPTLASIAYTPPTGVSAGLWYVTQAEIGPYAGPEPAGTETTVATATTAPFDAAVTSTVPDTVQKLMVTGGAGINPASVLPGASVTIPITITPTASLGTIVSGTLYVNGFAPGTLFGLSSPAFESLFTSDLAAIPYTYKVGP